MKMSERERLIEEIQKFHWSGGDDDFGGWDNSEEIADFILADRRRICAPLLALIEDARFYKEPVNIRIIETLKLAGLTKEKE